MSVSEKVVPSNSPTMNVTIGGVSFAASELRPDRELTPEEHYERTKGAVGAHYRTEDYYELGREKVREFANALYSRHPISYDIEAARAAGYDNIVAPATFIAIVGMLAQRNFFAEVVVGYDLSQIIQAEQKIEFYAPLTVGKKLFCDVYFDAFRRVAGTDIITTKNVVLDEDEQILLTSWTTIVGRTGHTDDHNELIERAKGMMMSER